MDRPSRLVITCIIFIPVMYVLRRLYANTLDTTDRKTKAVNYCESRDNDDGEHILNQFKAFNRT